MLGLGSGFRVRILHHVGLLHVCIWLFSLGLWLLLSTIRKPYPAVLPQAVVIYHVALSCALVGNQSV